MQKFTQYRFQTTFQTQAGSYQIRSFSCPSGSSDSRNLLTHEDIFKWLVQTISVRCSGSLIILFESGITKFPPWCQQTRQTRSSFIMLSIITITSISVFGLPLSKLDNSWFGLQINYKRCWMLSVFQQYHSVSPSQLESKKLLKTSFYNVWHQFRPCPPHPTPFPFDPVHWRRGQQHPQSWR